MTYRLWIGSLVLALGLSGCGGKGAAGGEADGDTATATASDAPGQTDGQDDGGTDGGSSSGSTGATGDEGDDGEEDDGGEGIPDPDIYGPSETWLALRKYSPEGEELWAYFERPEGLDDIGRPRVVANAEGEIYVAASAIGEGGAAVRLWVARFSMDGELEDAVLFNGDGRLSGLAIDSESRLFVSGTFGGRFGRMALLPDLTEHWALDTEDAAGGGQMTRSGIATGVGTDVWWAGSVESSLSWLRKLGPSGAITWERELPGEQPSYRGMAADATGSVYVVTAWGEDAEYSDLTVSKWSADGAMLWDETHEAVLATGGAVRPDGQVIASGFYNGQTGWQLWLASYGQSGALSWVDETDIPHSDMNAGVVACPDNDMVVTGSPQYYSASVQRLGSDGSLLWSAAFGQGEPGYGVSASGVACDATSNVIAVGVQNVPL